ncbi:hypothetical protein [Marimonas lutisalis]|uniref:hypothetical protein n=1 Tax=Marimonas lutisalis TaxID=2545756 RepID=UPI0010FA2A3F|nr:hypothetical protein [Marimonas lutisalis]
MLFGPILPTGRNASYIVLTMVFFAIQLFVLYFMINGGERGLFSMGKGSDMLGRPTLSSHLPPSLPGWHKRGYLPSDGEAITAAAEGRGIEARLAMGEDTEQFRLYEKAGINGASAVYVQGDQRIAIGLMRDPAPTPPWVDQTAHEADFGAKLEALKRGEVVAIVHGLAFQRRGAAGAELGYDRYVARLGHDLAVDVIANAPQIVVEQLLGQIDGAALATQLTEPSEALRPDLGVVLHHRPDTWPEKWPEAKPADWSETASET